MRMAVSLSVFAAVSFIFAACSHKQEAKSELEKTAALIEKTGGGEVPPASTAPQSQPAQPAPAAEQPPAAAAAPPQMMRQALAAYKTGNFEDAVRRLQMLRST